MCGIDEAGRGPLAGPVTAAAVVLASDFPRHELADSKKLSASRRAELELLIKTESTVWGVGWASHREIDEINILQASHLAMRRALHALLSEAMHGGHEQAHGVSATTLHAIVDGSITPHLPISAECVVKADGSVPEVMASSILAKEARDRWMIAYGRIEPRYGFHRHKGYPTREHRGLVQRYGPSAIHRHSFASKQVTFSFDDP